MAERALKGVPPQDILAAAGIPETAVEPEHLLAEESVLENDDNTLPPNSTARELGRITGRAVAATSVFQFLDLPGVVDDIRSRIGDTLRIIRQQTPGDITNPVEALRDKAACGIDTLRNRAQERLQLLRNRAGRLQRERPVELIAGAFGAAFLLGMALRIWRSNGD